MTLEDIVATLMEQDMITIHDSTQAAGRTPASAKYRSRGRGGGIARRNLARKNTQQKPKENKDKDKDDGPTVVIPSVYEIRWDKDYVDAYVRGWEKKGHVWLKPEKLKWSPFLLTRGQKADVARIQALVSFPRIEPISESFSLRRTPEPDEVVAESQSQFLGLDINGGADGDHTPIVNGNGKSKKSLRRSISLSQTGDILDENSAGPPPKRLRRQTFSTSTPIRLGLRSRSPKLATPKQVEDAEDENSRPTRLRTRSGQGSATMLTPFPGRPARSSKVAEHMEDEGGLSDSDSVYAAQLAREERSGLRMLRPRSSNGQFARGRVRQFPSQSGNSPSKQSSKKRKRVDSSSETEPSPPARPPSPPLPAERTTRSGKVISAGRFEATPTRTSTRRLNGTMSLNDLWSPTTPSTTSVNGGNPFKRRLRGAASEPDTVTTHDNAAVLPNGVHENANGEDEDEDAEGELDPEA
jgi:hypothetical protein